MKRDRRIDAHQTNNAFRLAGPLKSEAHDLKLSVRGLMDEVPDRVSHDNLQRAFLGNHCEADRLALRMNTDLHRAVRCCVVKSRQLNLDCAESYIVRNFHIA